MKKQFKTSDNVVKLNLVNDFVLVARGKIVLLFGLTPNGGFSHYGKIAESNQKITLAKLKYIANVIGYNMQPVSRRNYDISLIRLISQNNDTLVFETLDSFWIVYKESNDYKIKRYNFLTNQNQLVAHVAQLEFSDIGTLVCETYKTKNYLIIEENYALSIIARS